jgi:hypothetical protein
MGTNSQTFCANGCFTAPTGPHQTHVKVESTGGGGGGSPGINATCCPPPQYFAGGGGGGYARGNVKVVASQVYAVTVGGSAAGNTCGHDSSFTGACGQQVGGHGGKKAAGVLTGGAGGTGFGSAATTTFAGINGGNGGENCPPLGAGGSGGGACGSGSGGLGGVQTSKPNGCAPGGAGAGARWCSGVSTYPAGSGAHGRVKVTYACPGLCATASATPTSGSPKLCVAFKACPSGSACYTYLWKFKCACCVTSTAQDPTHQYAKTGKFHPTLTVTDQFCNTVCPSLPAICVTSGGGGKTGAGGPTLNRIGRIRAPKLSTSDRIETTDTNSGT